MNESDIEWKQLNTQLKYLNINKHPLPVGKYYDQVFQN